MMTPEAFLLLIGRLIALFTDMSLPAVPAEQPELPGDGRLFVWRMTMFGTASPMIVLQPDVGPRQEYLARHVLKPSEYADSLSKLAARYPPPEIKTEEERP